MLLRNQIGLKGISFHPEERKTKDSNNLDPEMSYVIDMLSARSVSKNWAQINPGKKIKKKPIFWGKWK